VTQFEYDPVVQRPEPDRDILARAHGYMLRTQTPMQAYLRQQWEAAISAVRVALDAWRKIWPIEGAEFEAEERLLMTRALDNIEDAYSVLDRLSGKMLGWPMDMAQLGHLSLAVLEDFERSLALREAQEEHDR
jgi:hypothetical protein